MPMLSMSPAERAGMRFLPLIRRYPLGGRLLDGTFQPLLPRTGTEEVGIQVKPSSGVVSKVTFSNAERHRHVATRDFRPRSQSRRRWGR